MSSKCSRLKNFLIKVFKRRSKELNARNAIEEIIEEEEGEPSQSIASDEKEMIGNVLDLRDIQVQDIMIPKVSIISISTTASIEEIISKFVENDLTKLLVYQGNSDNIIGVLHLKDIASCLNSYVNKYEMDNAINTKQSNICMNNKMNESNNKINMSKYDTNTNNPSSLQNINNNQNINSKVNMNNNANIQNTNDGNNNNHVKANCNYIDTSNGNAINNGINNNEINVSKDKINVNNKKSSNNINSKQDNTNIVNVQDITNKDSDINGNINTIKVNTDNINKYFNINLYIKKVLFIPPTMKTLDLLFQMKQTGNKTAVVIDEYGCVSGLVSCMDLMEEIVGDIKDATEIKQQKNKIIISNDGSIITDGKSTFYEIEKYGNLQITPNDDFNDTIGGMITSMIGRVPVKGELISFPKQSLEFEIVDADARRIKRIKIRENM